MIKNKKGQSFGLAGTVIFGVVGFIIMVVIALVVITSLTDADLFNDMRQSYTVTNETGTVAQGKWINQTGYTLAQANATTGQYAIIRAWNQSSGLQIPANNYSVSALGVVGNTTTATPYNNWNNVTFDYTFTDQASQEYLTNSLKANTTEGVNTISAKLGTVFLVVGMIIVLGIIGLMIVLIRRMGFGSSSNFGQ